MTLELPGLRENIRGGLSRCHTPCATGDQLAARHTPRSDRSWRKSRCCAAPPPVSGLGRDSDGASLCSIVLRRIGLAQLVERDQSHPSGVERGLRAVPQPQFAENTAHVGFDRLFGDSQFAGDLLVGGPMRQ